MNDLLAEIGLVQNELAAASAGDAVAN
jgi:hypothetical protein